MKYYILTSFCILNLFISFAQPANDEPCSATPLNVETSCNYVASDNLTATNTTGVTAPACANYVSEDVWFSFIVPANGTVSINSMEGSITDGGMAVYSGTCGSLTLVECDDSDSENSGDMPKIVLSGLTPGETLFIRFWQYGGGTGSFSLCIATTPDCGSSPPAGNTCATATPICDINGYCGNTSGNYTDDSWTSGGFFGGSGLDGVFCGTIENNSFLSFVASATSISFDVWVTSSTLNYGIQIFIFQSVGACSGDVTGYGPCYNPSVVEPGAITITAPGLTIGETYYIMIDGQAGDVCDYVIGANSGFNLPVNVDPISETICDGDQTTLTASGGDGVYTWDTSPDLNTTTGNTVIVTPSGVGVYNYTVNSLTGNVLCPASASATATITVVNCNGCNVTATNNGPICISGGTIDLFSTNVAGATFSWVGPNGYTSTDQNPSGITPPLTAGSYDYTVTADVGGVICTSTTTVVVNPLPIVDAGTYGTPCDDDPDIILAGSPSGGTFSGIGVSGNNFDPTVGTQTITYIYTDVSGCLGQDTQIITVINCGTGCNITASNNGPFCASSTTVNLTSTNVTGATYSWTGPNSFTSIDQNPVGVTFPTTAGSYIYTVTADVNGIICVATTTVIVNPIPVVDFTADILSGCAPLLVTFTNNSSLPGMDCLWNFGNGNTSDNCGSASNTYNFEGCYDVSLTLTYNGCNNTTNLQNLICVNEEAIASFQMTPDAGDVYQTEFEFTNLSTNASTYTWSFGNGVTSQVEDPSIIYDQEVGNYTVCLVAENSGGCNDSTCQIVVISDEVIFYVPNTFTPDGDEYNQVFKPIFTSGFDPYDFHLQIFNRWGEVIWESYDHTIGWDGTYLGKVAQDGTYAWKIDFKTSLSDERRVEIGHINIIK